MARPPRKGLTKQQVGAGAGSNHRVGSASPKVAKAFALKCTAPQALLRRITSVEPLEPAAELLNQVAEFQKLKVTLALHRCMRAKCEVVDFDIPRDEKSAAETAAEVSLETFIEKEICSLEETAAIRRGLVNEWGRRGVDSEETYFQVPRTTLSGEFGRSSKMDPESSDDDLREGETARQSARPSRRRRPQTPPPAPPELRKSQRQATATVAPFVDIPATDERPRRRARGVFSPQPTAPEAPPAMPTTAISRVVEARRPEDVEGAVAGGRDHAAVVSPATLQVNADAKGGKGAFVYQVQESLPQLHRPIQKKRRSGSAMGSAESKEELQPQRTAPYASPYSQYQTAASAAAAAGTPGYHQMYSGMYNPYPQQQAMWYPSASVHGMAAASHPRQAESAATAYWGGGAMATRAGGVFGSPSPGGCPNYLPADMMGGGWGMQQHSYGMHGIPLGQSNMPPMATMGGQGSAVGGMAGMPAGSGAAFLQASMGATPFPIARGQTPSDKKQEPSS